MYLMTITSERLNADTLIGRFLLHSLYRRGCAHNSYLEGTQWMPTDRMVLHRFTLIKLWWNGYFSFGVKLRRSICDSFGNSYFSLSLGEESNLRPDGRARSPVVIQIGVLVLARISPWFFIGPIFLENLFVRNVYLVWFNLLVEPIESLFTVTPNFRPLLRTKQLRRK